MAARFCQFTQKEFEDFLRVKPDGTPMEKGGWYRIPVYGTIEAVYSKFIHPELCLRIYSTLEHGVARDCGSDAIRVCVVWKPSPEEQRRWESNGLVKKDQFDPNRPIWPLFVGNETRVHRVKGWRDNLGNRLTNHTELVPPPCAKCGCPSVWRTPKKNQTWAPFWGCVWARNCPGTRS